MIDLRSDTITRPTQPMLDAMFSAKVGDDVWGDDPTVNELEAKSAAMFGMEAALFCASGTMSNQIGINIQTRPGDEVVCHKLSHVYYYEGGGIMRNSGASVCLLDGERGLITAKQVEQSINPDDVHRPVTTLVSVENTMNKGGGAIYNFNDLIAIGEVCRLNNIKYHLDGARLFNALVETKETPEDYGKLFDTISICLSKGLGAPVGSVLLGKADAIKRARRVRKVFGGGMRQAGYLAAAGIYALENNINRLKTDHERARKIAEVLNNCNYVSKILPVDSNIIIFELNNRYTEQQFISKLAEENILAVSLSAQSVRFVTHLDFTDTMLEKLISVLLKLN